MTRKSNNTLPVHIDDLPDFLEIEKRVLYKSVSRDVALALGIPVKKCRKLMRKNAPGYILDYDNLNYWAGEVPQHIVDTFGEDIVEISRLVSEGASLSELSKRPSFLL